MAGRNGRRNANWNSVRRRKSEWQEAKHLVRWAILFFFMFFVLGWAIRPPGIGSAGGFQRSAWAAETKSGGDLRNRRRNKTRVGKHANFTHRTMQEEYDTD